MLLTFDVQHLNAAKLKLKLIRTQNHDSNNGKIFGKQFNLNLISDRAKMLSCHKETK